MKFNILIITALFLCSCKSDPDSNNHSDIEKIYFEDYVSPNFKWAFIDESGNNITDAIYDDARDFSESLAAVNYEGRWGYINRSGNPIIDCQYKQVTDFTNGRAFAQNFDNKWILLNSVGTELTVLDYETYKKYHYGYCPVARQNAWGIIDRSGDEIVACNYSDISVIKKGKIIAGQFNKYGILNFNMDTLLAFDYDKIWPSINGKMKFRKNDSFGYIDENNLLEASELYESASNYQTNNAVVFDGNNYLLLNKDYTVLKTLDFDVVRSASQNMWKFKENGLWGLLNEKGDVISRAQYSSINNFESNRASFQQDGYWGYIDINGNEVIPPLLGICWDYKDNYVRIIGGRGYGVLDTSGLLVIEDKYKEIRDFHEGICRIQTFE